MISLSRHIELLLLEHDCVIAPGLGGFIANHAPARYNDGGDNLFLPPYRNVCFNRNLQTNDGLLVQAYMNAYDASYPDAYKQMSNDIEDALDTIDVEGAYELHGIGMLSKDISGHITFTAYDSGILTPALYGLYSISIKSKEEAERERQVKQALQATNVLPIQTERDEQETFAKPAVASEKSTGNHGYSKFVDIAVACAASILLFFIFSYPTNQGTGDTDTCMASAVSINTENKKQEINTIPVKTTETTSVTTETKVDAQPEKVESTATPTVTTDTPDYTIVLASCVMESNANDLINRLNKAGYTSAEFVKGDKMNRVVYSSYTTFEEATLELKSLKQESSFFKDAWVYKNMR